MTWIFNCHQSKESAGFILIIEILAIMIRTNQNIKPVQVEHIKLLLSMFADDVNIFMPNDPNSWESLKSTIKSFEAISGLKVNYDQTNVYRISSANSC